MKQWFFELEIDGWCAEFTDSLLVNSLFGSCDL